MAALVLPVLVLGLLALALRQPRAVLLLALFVAGWGGLDVDVGLRLTGYQLAMAPLCLAVALRLAWPGFAARGLAIGPLFVALLLYSVVVSAFQIGFLPAVTIDNSALRGPVARAIIQILLFLFVLAPVVLVPLLMRGPADARRLLRVWFGSMITLAVIGWVQLALWYGTGTNPLPVGAVNGWLGGSADYNRQGIFVFEGLGLFRMNSLAGEPRSLGTLMAISMVAIQGLALAQREVPGRRWFALWLFFLVTALFTYSTSAVALWLIGTAGLLPAMLLTGVRVQRSLPALTGVVLAVSLLVGGAVVAATAAGIPIIEIVSERTIDRLEASGAVEDFDLAISDWLLANPDRLWLGAGLGNAHLFATPYLDPVFAGYAEGQVFQAKTLGLRLVSEIGIIGFSLFLAFYLSRVLAAGWARREPQLAPLLPLSMVLLLLAMANSALLNELVLVAGVLVLVAGMRPQPAPAVAAIA